MSSKPTFNSQSGRRLIAIFLMTVVSAGAQYAQKINPTRAKTHYSWAISQGRKAFDFVVLLTPEDAVSGVKVFRAGSAAPLQTVADAIGLRGASRRQISDDAYQAPQDYRSRA